jgi:hypothetical protein
VSLVFRRYLRDAIGNFRRVLLFAPEPARYATPYRVVRRYGRAADGAYVRQMRFFTIGPPVTSYVGVRMAFDIIRSAGMTRGRIR